LGEEKPELRLGEKEDGKGEDGEKDGRTGSRQK